MHEVEKTTKPFDGGVLIYNKEKRMDDYEIELLNMSQEEMEKIANADDTL